MHCLERLYLTHNEFEEISRNITELVHLTTLDLSHNHISHLPPTKAWTNTRMNKLSLAFNNLMTITHQTEEDQTYTRSGARPRTEGERRGRSSTAFATYVFLHVHFICTSHHIVRFVTLLHIQYLTLLSLHTITVLPLTIVYFMSEVHCTLNVLHSNTP